LKKIEAKTINVNLFEKNEDYGKIQVKSDVFGKEKEQEEGQEQGDVSDKDEWKPEKKKKAA